VSNATIEGISLEEMGPVGRKLTRKFVTVTVEFEIDYPIDMPSDLILPYVDSIAQRVKNYAASQAKAEEESHK